MAYLHYLSQGSDVAPAFRIIPYNGRPLNILSNFFWNMSPAGATPNGRLVRPVLADLTCKCG